MVLPKGAFHRTKTAVIEEANNAHFEAHYADVKRAFGNRPLHRLPLKEIITTTALTLNGHSDFEIVEHTPRVTLPQMWRRIVQPERYFAPATGKRNGYLPHDLAHRLLVDRLVSQLVARHDLPESSAVTFKQALGLSGSTSFEKAGVQLQAIDRLNERLTPLKFNNLLSQAIVIWQHQRGELVDAAYEIYGTPTAPSDPSLRDQVKLAIPLFYKPLHTGLLTKLRPGATVAEHMKREILVQLSARK